MILRIAIWAGLGALLVVAWKVYISATFANPLGAGALGRALVHLACPITIASHPQTFYFDLAMNATTYALAGVVVETARQYYNIRSNPN